MVEGTLPGTGTATAAPTTGDYRKLLTAPLRSAAHERSDTPRPSSPCLRNARSRLVAVSIAKEHLWACAGHRTVISTPVTTGRRGEGTPRGTFAVQARVANTTLHPADGNAVHVSYWIPFRQNIWGFHDAPWQTMPFGSSGYRTQGSLGCVHVPIGALRRLFHWVRNGTVVRIS